MTIYDLQKMENRTGRPIDVILDTDTYNEIDDQFALSYLCCFPERIHLKAFTAAPFFNGHSTSPEDGMLRSYQEILNLLTLMEREDLKDRVYCGSVDYLKDEQTPQPSEAAQVIIEQAMAHSKQDPLYIVAIGAITNVASALLLEPAIADRIAVVWLGGNTLEWPQTKEFNMYQDIPAARVVFDRVDLLVQFPCMGSVSTFTVSGPELDAFLVGKNPLADYLAQHTIEEVRGYCDSPIWTRVIWDVCAVSWLAGDFVDTRILPRPIPEADFHYGSDFTRKPYLYVWQIHRDELLRDLVEKLTAQAWKKN